MNRIVLILRRHAITLVLAALLLPASISFAQAADAGRVKVSKGSVTIERGGARLPAPVGTPVQQSDVVVTGADGAVGISFADSSLLSAGPNSILVISKFAFDPTTQKGEFDTELRKGTLTAVSGRIVKQSPGAMRVKTPAAIMGVRGTQFAVRVADTAQ